MKKTKDKEKQIENKNDDKKQKEIQNQQLKRILITGSAIIIVFLLGFAIINSIRHFEYRGLKFNVVKEGRLVFYNVVFPIYSSVTGKHVADYNIYLRKDPRKLEKIPFDGKMNLDTPLRKMVFESKYEKNCEGDFNIAIANFVKSFGLIGIQVIKDENASCDSYGRYMYIVLQEGNETSIEQFGPACYNINIKDCEILEGTERFIVEAFSEFDNKIYY